MLQQGELVHAGVLHRSSLASFAAMYEAFAPMSPVSWPMAIRCCLRASSRAALAASTVTSSAIAFVYSASAAVAAFSAAVAAFSAAVAAFSAAVAFSAAFTWSVFALMAMFAAFRAAVGRRSGLLRRRTRVRGVLPGHVLRFHRVAPVGLDERLFGGVGHILRRFRAVCASASCFRAFSSSAIAVFCAFSASAEVVASVALLRRLRPQLPQSRQPLQRIGRLVGPGIGPDEPLRSISRRASVGGRLPCLRRRAAGRLSCCSQLLLFVGVIVSHLLLLLHDVGISLGARVRNLGILLRRLCVGLVLLRLLRCRRRLGLGIRRYGVQEGIRRILRRILRAGRTRLQW